MEPKDHDDEVSTLCEGTPDLDQAFGRMARMLVGRMGLKQALGRLRAEMNHEALKRTGGSRRAAAQMLQVDRRYVQRLVHQNGEPDYLRRAG